jgi:hypothetical protein
VVQEGPFVQDLRALLLYQVVLEVPVDPLLQADLALPMDLVLPLYLEDPYYPVDPYLQVSLAFLALLVDLVNLLLLADPNVKKN